MRKVWQRVDCAGLSARQWAKEEGVVDGSAPATEARVLVAAHLSEVEPALDGFPAAALIEEWLQLAERDAEAARRTRHVIVHVLAAWALTIERDLEAFPPATMEALQAIRQRMVDSRNALQRLLRLLKTITEPLASLEPN
jgi:hypothetical protein